MFQPNYYQEEGKYCVDILLLGETVIDSIQHNSLKELVQVYIDFEEEFYGVKFSDEIKELRYRNVELEFEFESNKETDKYNEIISVNAKLQRFYTKMGFDKLRKEIRDNYIQTEIKDLEIYGGDTVG